MASSIQILRSTTAKERPFPGSLLEGQPAVNVNATEPGLFFKASDGTLFKIGPAAITTDGAPPNTGGVGQQGNCVGELWLDKSLNPPVLKVYDGTNWIDAGSGGGGGGGTGAFVRWIYTAVGGETTLSGSSGGISLEYEPGLEEVFVNGVLISRGTDYIATSGTSITGLTPLSAGDIVTVVSDIPLETVLIPGPATLLRWFIQASSGQTVLSGFDSSSQVLAYTPGLEEVYINGVLLVRNTDYTADDGTSITITDPLIAGDFVNVLAFSSSGTTPLPPPTPVSVLRWYLSAAAGQTVLSGPDDDGLVLDYTPGLEEVFVNGAFLRRGSDYVATNGTTISLSSPLALDDEVTVLAFSAFQGVSISSAEIQDGAITNSKISDGAVTSAKILDGTIVNADVSPSADIASTKLGCVLPTNLWSSSQPVARSVQSKLNDFVSVKDFGAVGDTVADDTQAFQAAINYACQNRVGLYVPSPRATPSTGGRFYKITAPLNIPSTIEIFGDGPGSSTILWTSGLSAGQYALDFNLAAGTNYHARVENLTIRAVGSAVAGTAMRIKNVSYLTVRNVEFYSFYDGMSVTGVNCFSNFFEKVTFYDISHVSFLLENFTGGGQYKFDSCTFTGDVGFYVTSNSAADDFTLLCCNFEQCVSNSFRCEGSIRGLSFLSCRTEGLNGSSDFVIYPSVGNEVTGLVVTGCSFSTDAGASVPIFLDGNGGIVRGFSITGNSVAYAAFNNFVQLNGGGESGLIAGNRFSLTTTQPINTPRDGVTVFSNENAAGKCPEFWGTAPWGVTEGTFTPSWTGSTITGNATPLTNSGRYRKIGDVVEVWIRGTDLLNAYSTAPTGDVRIGNLPYPTSGAAIGTCLAENVDFTNQIVAEGQGTYIRLRNVTGSKTIASTTVAWSDVADPGGDVTVYMSYKTV